MQLRDPGAGTCLVPSATSVLLAAVCCAVVVETSVLVCAMAMPPTPKAAVIMVARINFFMAGSEVVLPHPLMAIVLPDGKAGAGFASPTTAFVHDGSRRPVFIPAGLNSICHPTPTSHRNRDASDKDSC